jgi:hypothetical protein
MPNEITPKIFNPAAVVKTTARPPSGGSGENKPVQNSNPAVNVEVSPQVSAVSRARAGAGDSAVSAETAQAVASGKLPPQIIAQKIPAASVQAATDTADIQRAAAVAQVTNPEGLQPEPVENIEALVRAAQAFDSALALSGESVSIPASAEALSSAPVIQQAPTAVQTQDTATAALGNTADITV